MYNTLTQDITRTVDQIHGTRNMPFGSGDSITETAKFKQICDSSWN